MDFYNRNGYLLLDVMISLVVISLAAEILYRYYLVVSDSAQYVYTKYRCLHNAMKTMDYVLHTKHYSHNNPDTSVHYTHLNPNVIEGKPLNYSYNFETDFTFVTIATSCKTPRKNNAPLVLVSAMKKS